MEKELKEHDLHLVESDEADRLKIDFKICDSKNEVCAEVFGDDPGSAEISCEHPIVEFDDDETVGECPVCGACAHWHYETNADDGYIVKDRVVHEWENQDKVGGIIGKILAQTQEENKSGNAL